MGVRLAVVVLVACGGGKHGVEDGPRPVPVGSDAGSAVAPAGAKGDAQVRVEWKDVPVAMRASPGKTSCKTARAPYIAPTTTWGVPDAIVWADAGPPPNAAVRVTLHECVLSPRVAVAKVGGVLAIASETEGPAGVAVVHYGDPKVDKSLAGIIETPGSMPAGVLDRVSLPVVGHEVDVELAKPAVDSVTAEGGDPDPAWVVTSANAAGVTDAAGQVVLRELPVGKVGVTAWIPPRAGQGARVVHGSVEVVAGGQAEVTLTIEK